MKKNNRTTLPDLNSSDKTEKDMYRAYTAIIRDCIVPYLKKEDKEKQDKYLEKYPDLFEIMSVITSIYDMDTRDKKIRLYQIIEGNIKKTKKILEARELEKKYENELKKIEKNKND